MYDFVRGCLVILKCFYKALDHGILDQAVRVLLCSRILWGIHPYHKPFSLPLIWLHY